MGDTALFTTNQIEAIAKIICDNLSMTEIQARLVEEGIPTNLSANSAKRGYLKETLENWQNSTKDPNYILRFIEYVMQPINFIGRDETKAILLNGLRSALSYCGYELHDDGIISDRASNTVSYSEPESSPSIVIPHDVRNDDDVPLGIRESLEKFRKRHPNSQKTGFIMMRFGSTLAHTRITNAIKNTLMLHGLEALRADDEEYNPDLFSNIQTYMHGCGFGIAIFERFESDEFNSNVGLEIGYMLALRKPVCLVKDKTLKTLQTDLMGKQYKPFDPQNIEATVSNELIKWLRDYNLF